MPTARWALAPAGARNGRLYAVGGNTGGAVEAYEPVGNAWTARTGLPTGRQSVGVAVAGNGKLYAVRGQLGPGGAVTAAVEEGTLP
jgi:hypothetical protein